MYYLISDLDGLPIVVESQAVGDFDTILEALLAVAKEIRETGPGVPPEWIAEAEIDELLTGHMD